MKYTFLLLSWILLVTSCEKELPDGESAFERSYTFDKGVVPRNVLESYLSRSITQAEFLTTAPFYNDGDYPDKADDERMILSTGAKFIGRSVYSWDFPEHFNSPAFMAAVKQKIDEMHQKDPDLLFQAAIFEIVSTKVETVSVPSWVFEDFNLPVENRKFRYADMLNKDGQFVNFWRQGASVPDISRLETQLFFYFMACQYIDAGIEAIHFGQAELMAMADNRANFAGWSGLLSKIRKAALTRARRATVLCDAHLPSGGLVVGGKHLFDFVSFPMRPKEVIGNPYKAELKKFYADAMYGRTRGGLTPGGWECENLPYIVEFDNFGTSDHPGKANLNDNFVWGYDEISWFANQPEAYRNEFLEYAVDWIRKVDKAGYIQMPGSRVAVGSTERRYRANTNSAACTTGKNQEETIKKIWKESN